MIITKEDLRLLEDIRQTYVRSAEHVAGWKTMDKNKLINLYLDNEHNEPERSYYFSALMCRYWSNVYRFYRASRSTRLEISDFTSWLAEAFFVAFKYRKWKDPLNKLYSDPQAPDKVVNRCIFSTRMRYYQYYNMDKRKVNFQTDSIERQLETFGHMADVNNYLVSEDVNKEDEKCKQLVHYYLSKNNIFTAIIIDLICFNDTFREIRSVQEIETDEDITEKDVSENEYELTPTDDESISVDENVDYEDSIEEYDDSSEEEFNSSDNESNTKVIYDIEFSMRKLLSVLREIDSDYMSYFVNRYETEESELVSTVNKIKELSLRRRLSRVVNTILTQISEDKKVREILC